MKTLFNVRIAPVAIGMLAMAIGACPFAGCTESTDSSEPLPSGFAIPQGNRLDSPQTVGYQPTSPHGPPVDVYPSGAHLSYYGGPTVPHARVIEVLYGSGSYLPQVLPTSPAPNMATLYNQMVTSGVYDWLGSDYNNTFIGRGSFYGAITVSPLPLDNGSTISDAQIQDDLQNEFSKFPTYGGLPAPDNNLVYMIHFPPGKSIAWTDANNHTYQSCVPSTQTVTGFCGYHNSFPISTLSGTQNVYYAVLPDLSGPCYSLCVTSATDTYTKQSVVASHELIETITDPVPPQSWKDDLDQGDHKNEEIGDLCAAGTPPLLSTTQVGYFLGTDSYYYYVQQEFSNSLNDCMTTRSTTPNMSDILWRALDSGNVDIWFMNGASKLSDIQYTNPGSNWLIKGVGDFDGDGKSDILWRTSTNDALAIWLSGNPLTVLYPADTLGSAYTIQGVGDFDGDGKSDILWRATNNTAVTFWFMHGAASPRQANATCNPGYSGCPDPGSAWQINGVADFDGDGRSDILWRSTDYHMAIWFMNQELVFTEGYPIQDPGSYWTIQSTGDFDGDGKSDILWRTTDLANVDIWFMNSASKRYDIQWYNSPGTNWTIKGVGDFDGDGKSDILWWSNSLLMIWFMNGSGIGQTQYPGPYPGTSWAIVGTGNFN